MPPSVEISVVIPTLNRWALLRETLRGALSQQGVDAEVIVIDDGSVEAGSPALGVPQDRRLRLIRHERPKGVAAARNRGIFEARGEWIALLDDDDLWAPNKLRTQLAAARAAGAGFAYASAVHVDRDLRPLQIERAPAPERLTGLLLSHNAIPAGSSNVIARREILRELGGFDERFFHLADWDLWLRLAQRTAGAACEEVMVAYVKHPENMLGVGPHAFFRELSRFEARHCEAAQLSGVELDRVAVARWVAFTHRQSGRRLRAAKGYLRAMRFGKRRMNFGSAVRSLSESRPPLLPRPSIAAVPDWLEAYGSRGSSQA